MAFPKPSVLLLALAATLLIAFMKGALGGGFAIVGIPLLSLAMTRSPPGALEAQYLGRSPTSPCCCPASRPASG